MYNREYGIQVVRQKKKGTREKNRKEIRMRMRGKERGDEGKEGKEKRRRGGMQSWKDNGVWRKHHGIDVLSASCPPASLQGIRTQFTCFVPQGHHRPGTKILQWVWS